MKNPPVESLTRPVAILLAILGLSACTTPNPGPPPRVQVPIDVVDSSTTIPSARLSWHSNGPDTEPGSSNFGVEVEYARGIGRSDQQVGGNEFVTVGGRDLLGPQEVHHRADLRYGHVALTGITRFQRKASGIELEWIAGLGQARLDLRSESSIPSNAALAATYGYTGMALGVGPRWNITSKLALEGRLQLISSWANSDDRLWNPQIAVRYRPVRNVAFRVGYSSMDYHPSRRNEDSRVKVRTAGPFLGLQAMF